VKHYNGVIQYFEPVTLVQYARNLELTATVDAQVVHYIILEMSETVVSRQFLHFHFLNMHVILMLVWKISLWVGRRSVKMQSIILYKCEFFIHIKTVTTFLITKYELTTDQHLFLISQRQSRAQMRLFSHKKHVHNCNICYAHLSNMLLFKEVMKQFHFPLMSLSNRSQRNRMRSTC
jgi:hypothetical protein